jgi:hypothetical protein
MYSYDFILSPNLQLSASFKFEEWDLSAGSI